MTPSPTTSPASSPTTTANAFEALTIDPASGLAYRVRRAATATPATPTARVVLLHGVGGNETNLEPLSALIDAHVEIFLVRGPLTFGPTQFGWFEVSFASGSPVIDAAQAERSRVQLIELLQALNRTATCVAVPAVIAGFSQGGILSASVGLSAPQHVTGFGILSGRILPEIAPRIADRTLLADVSAFVAHGTDDAKLPVQWAQRSDALLQSHGLKLTSHRYPVGHEISQDMATDFATWLHATLMPD